MKAVSALLFACALLIPFTAAQARLGETQEQIQERYGKPVSVNKPAAVALHRWNDYYIRVEYRDGRAVLLGYRRRDKQPMTEQETNAALARHAGASEWLAKPPAPGFRKWRSADGARQARYSTVNGLLTFAPRSSAES